MIHMPRLPTPVDEPPSPPTLSPDKIVQVRQMSSQDTSQQAQPQEEQNNVVSIVTDPFPTSMHLDIDQCQYHALSLSSKFQHYAKECWNDKLTKTMLSESNITYDQIFFDLLKTSTRPFFEFLSADHASSAMLRVKCLEESIQLNGFWKIFLSAPQFQSDLSTSSHQINEKIAQNYKKSSGYSAMTALIKNQSLRDALEYGGTLSSSATRENFISAGQDVVGCIVDRANSLLKEFGYQDVPVNKSAEFIAVETTARPATEELSHPNPAGQARKIKI